MSRSTLFSGRKILFMILLLSLFSFLTRQSTQANPTLPPIAVVVNDAAPSPFGRYLGEILRAEGLNAYDFLNLSTATLAELNQYQMVILAQTPLTGGQATLFTNFVNGGGRLLAMRPDSQIAGLFGLAGKWGAE